MKILFIAPRFPNPLYSGHRLRAYHQLRLLSRKHRITLLCLSGSGQPLHGASEVARYCNRIVAIPVRRADMVTGLFRGSLYGLPWQVSVHLLPRMTTAVDEALHGGTWDVTHTQMARMAPYLDRQPGVPRLIDLIDSMALNMLRRSSCDPHIMGFIAGLEARQIGSYEAGLCQTWDCATVVSDVDRKAIGAQLPGLTVNANGVDVEAFAGRTAGRDRRELLFVGNLGYFPNVDGIVWFARNVLPLIRRRVPQTKLTIVGARPAAPVRRLPRQDPGIRLHPFVPDVRPFLARCAVSVAPIRAGSGQLFKVLEAMAAGTPIVATSVASSGVAAEHGRHLLVADSAEDFAEQVSRLLLDPSAAERMALAARLLVEERYSWERSVAELERLYESIAQ
ncbi:MAG: glycosyltransferase [Candidatus Schekmanbacteria bacterium]|nr:glycosyltransferase [Candidatus Schekmanbacteria bacterium]